MKAILKTLFAGLMAGVLSITPFNQAYAQSAPEPAVVISVANLDNQMGALNYMVEAAGFGQMGFLIKVQADQYLKGIDRSKPSGALLYFEEDTPEPKVLGFIPIKNFDDVLNTLADNVGEIEEGDDFVTLTTDGEQEVLIKQVGDYAFISDSAAMFENIPDDVSGNLGDLPKNYNLAFKVFGQRVPEALREQAINLVRDGYEAQLEQAGGVDAIQANLQKQNFEMQMEQIKSFINETDHLTLGMNADKENGSLYMDFQFVGLAGSKLAEQCAASANSGPTMFAGFLMEGSAFNFNSCSKILPADSEQFTQLMKQGREEIIKGIDEDGNLTDEDLDRIEGIVETLLDAIEETIKAGTIDSGGVLMMDTEINLALGLRMADPGKIEDAVKNLVAFAEEKGAGDAFEVNLNSGSYDGVNFHTITVPVPEGEEEARAVLGDKVEIQLGIGENAFYMGAGANPMDLLKKAMDASKSAPPAKSVSTQYNLYLAPILRFASSIEGEEMLESMADKLEEAGKDRISVVADMVENGMKMRFEMQDGILKLISVAAQSMGGQFGGGGDDF